MTTTTGAARDALDDARDAYGAALDADDADPTRATARAVRVARAAMLAAEPTPHCNDAAGWDDYRRRLGYSGCHH